MKMKIFNAANCLAAKSSKSIHIAFSSKSGVFRFNKYAVELLALKEKEQIEFTQDESKPESWYLTKVETNGFEITYKKGLNFNNSQLAGVLVASLNGRANGSANYRIKIIDQAVTLEGKEYWPLEIITAVEPVTENDAANK